ncbi:hypothetical protein CsatB_011431 [Cannabis sativa]
MMRSGDVLTLVAVLQQVNSPMGYRVRVDSGSRSMVGTNHKKVEEARAAKEFEYFNKPEINEITKQCYADQIDFHVRVVAGRGGALEQAKESEVTWLILDKEMKREKKFFLERLNCDISVIKRGKSIEELRVSKQSWRSKEQDHEISCNTNKLSIGTNSKPYLRYDEMIPGSPEEKHSQQKGKKDDDIGESSSLNMEGEDEHKNDEDWMAGFETDDELMSICSICENRRPKIGWTKEFSYAELHAATKGFSKANYISEGGFGNVFRGQLKNGLKIAVKQHKHASSQGEKEFKAEVHFLSKARHKNLIMLLGSCSEGRHRLLVYEYVCNGSLDRQLLKPARKPLTWDERMKIASGAAKGLLYLHKNNIVHRDIRPNNILLTHDFNTLLGDFGLARSQQEDHSSETRVVGTLGYLAPEYAESGKVSTKTDVYAFGVILLQLITGHGTNDKSLEGKSLVGWARPLLKDRNYPDLIDERILDSHDVHQLFWMVRVAEKCLIKDPHKRLSMETIVNALNHLRESDVICNISISPAYSDNSLPGSEESPKTYDNRGDDDHDNSHHIEVESYKSRHSMAYYDHITGSISQSSWTQSTSSSRSSLSPMSEQSSLDGRLK